MIIKFTIIVKQCGIFFSLTVAPVPEFYVKAKKNNEFKKN